MSSFWHWWVIILTTITIVLVTWILLANRKKVGDEPTTGHVYDGIEEYDNPLPQWWLIMFLGSIVFSIGYLIVFPGMGNYKGIIGWTQEGRYEAEMAAADSKYGALYAQFSNTPAEELAQNPKAMKMAQRIFSNNCAQCHGSDAAGAFGFPNLRDNDWLYGGEVAQIKQSITLGRTASMPPWGAIIDSDSLNAVVDYVGNMGDTHAGASAGKATYDTFCVACHGPKGDGNIYLGAPRLNDDIWLYGGSASQIKLSIRKGRTGKMPAHESVLSTDKIHLLSAYVYSLSQ